MTSMRERMARAAVNELNRQDQEHRGMQDLNKVVDAILAEMETPSVEVIDAAYKAEAEYDNGTIDAWCGLSSAFRAMIRAIRDGK